METNAVGKTPAPYGQACSNCVKAKCRCMLRDGGVCDRCHRLGKECRASSAVRRRAPRSNQAPKRSKLEDKLDEVVSLLRTQRTAPLTISPNDQLVLTPDSSVIPHQGTDGFDNDKYLSSDQVHDFRTSYLYYFPFMPMSENTTTNELYLKYPLFCHAIRTILTKAITKQSQLSKHLREQLASRIIVQGERSIDLLLTVIMCIAWSPYFTHGKQFLGSMCGLAKTLISDLRLDKPMQPAGCPSLGPRVDNKEVRKTEGSRAFLSVFILCANVAVIFEYDLMLWSSQIEDACDHLTKNKECEGDVILVAAVRLAKIVVSAAEVSRRASDDHNTAKHAMMAIDPLILALNNFKSSLPIEVLQHWLIIGLNQTAQVAIYDLALLTKPSEELSVSHLAFEPRRIEYFMELLETSKACREHAWNGGVIGLTAPSMLVFSYCIKTLYRFASLKGIPDWIPPIVQSSFDIVQCLERFAEIAEQANTEFKAKTGEDTLFAAAAETLRAMAPNWKLPTTENDDDMGNASDGWNGSFGDFGALDFSSDFWLPNAFNP